MSWDALKLWGSDAELVGPLTGGVANDVWEVRLGERRAVARRGSRTEADLNWEAELLLHLDRNGLAVPVPLPSIDGHMAVDGLMVMSWVEGRPPVTVEDWRRVAAFLRRLHEVTRGWPQRPGWRSSRDLLTEERGTRIDMTAMPAEAVVRCRAAWAQLDGLEMTAIHGDPNPRNILITSERVALIDWDEAHVDVPLLDLDLPHGAAGFDEAMARRVQQASAAWQAAVCWDDDYARRKLAEVRRVPD